MDLQNSVSDSVKYVYNIVEKYSTYIPIENHRYRLSYMLLKIVTGEENSIPNSVTSAKLSLVGITEKELTAKLEEELKKFQIK